MKARGKEDPHLSSKGSRGSKDNKGIPRVSMDYAEIGEAGTEGAARKLLIGRDRYSKSCFCHLVKCKGLGDDWIVDKILESIKEIGNTKMTL